MAADNGNGLQNGAGTNGGGKSPAIIVPKKGAVQDIQQRLTKDPYFTIPPISTFAGRYNEVNKSYYVYFDEALRSSQANTLSMRRDGYIEELLNHRRLPIISLPFHMEVDDPEHPDQTSISEMVQKIVNNVPRLKNMMISLMEAIFYGRYGAQIQLGPRKVGGNEWTSVVRHSPINGDKFRYLWNGTPGIAIYAGDRDPKSDEDMQTKFLEQNKQHIKTTMLGPALYLETQALKDRFVIHNFQGSDTDYLFEIDEAQSIFGIGLRSRLYWTWNLRTEIWSWIVDSLQRIGASGLIYGFYPVSNQAAQREALNALSQLVKDNIGVFPVPAGFEGKLTDWLQRIEPSPVGYEVMERLVDKLDGIMRRAFLGQDLSSESKPLGIGGGAAALHSDVRIDTIKYDAGMLAETLTEQLVSVIVRYNTWKYEGKALRGDDLPFSLKFVFDIDSGDGPERMAAAQALFAMGVPLDQDEVRKVAGFSPPKKKANILTNPELEMQKQQNQAGVPQFDKASEHLKGIVGEGKKAQQMGMMGGGGPKMNGASRFSKADDCGHDPDGDFSLENTCAAGGLSNKSSKDNRNKLIDISKNINKKLNICDFKAEGGCGEFSEELEYALGKMNIPAKAQSIDIRYNDVDNYASHVFIKSGDYYVDSSGVYDSIDELINNFVNAAGLKNKKIKIDYSGDENRYARFSKSSDPSEYHEGGEEISDKDKTITVHQVGEILTKQYYNRQHKDYSAEEMIENWLSSDKYTLVKDIPIWVLRPYKYEAPDDKSHSKGPLIVDANKRNRKLKYGSFGSDPECLICDGKHRYWMAIRDGQKSYDCYVGDAILDDMKKYIHEFSGKRSAFIRSVYAYYREQSPGNKSEVMTSGMDCGLTEKQLSMFFSNYKKGIKYNFDYGCFEDRKFPDPNNKSEKSRFHIKAGSAEDCGHHVAGDPSAGHFDDANTCAEGGHGTDWAGKKRATKKDALKQAQTVLSGLLEDLEGNKKDEDKPSALQQASEILNTLVEDLVGEEETEPEPKEDEEDLGPDIPEDSDPEYIEEIQSYLTSNSDGKAKILAEIAEGENYAKGMAAALADLEADESLFKQIKEEFGDDVFSQYGALKSFVKNSVKAHENAKEAKEKEESKEKLENLAKGIPGTLSDAKAKIVTKYISIINTISDDFNEEKMKFLQDFTNLIKEDEHAKDIIKGYYQNTSDLFPDTHGKKSLGEQLGVKGEPYSNPSGEKEEENKYPSLSKDNWTNWDDIPKQEQYKIIDGGHLEDMDDDQLYSDYKLKYDNKGNVTYKKTGGESDKKDQEKSHKSGDQNNPSEVDGYVNYYNKTKNKNPDADTWKISSALKKIHDDAKFTAAFEKWNDDQKNALRHYTASNYEEMNAYLRKGDYIDDYDKKAIYNLSKGLEVSELPEDMIVYRGVKNLTGINEKIDPKNPDSLIGVKFHDKGFLSTTMNKGTAVGFAGTYGAVFELKASKGMNAITTDSKGTHDNELEFVFDKGHSVEITGWRREGTRLVLEAKIVDPRKEEKEKTKTSQAESEKKKKFPSKISDLKIIKSLGGATGAEMVEDPETGNRFVRKSAPSVQEEVHADNIYKALGINVPETKLYEEGGKKYKLSKFVDGKHLSDIKKEDPELYQKAKENLRNGFVADALLANWDVIGGKYEEDNILVQPDGSVYRIDNGGALRYSGLGEKKKDKLTDRVNDLKSMQDFDMNKESASIFSGITDDEIEKQVKHIWSKKNEILDQIKDEELSDIIHSRILDLRKRFL